jgi:hypothetical protein
VYCCQEFVLDRLGIPRKAHVLAINALDHALRDTCGEMYTAQVRQEFRKSLRYVASKMLEAEYEEFKCETTLKRKDFPQLNDFRRFMADDICVEYLHLYLVSEMCEGKVSQFLKIQLQAGDHVGRFSGVTRNLMLRVRCSQPSVEEA